jgi:transposase-like protein
LSAIDQAQAGGARLVQACQMVGISARTIDRWRDQPEATMLVMGPITVRTTLSRPPRSRK